MDISSIILSETFCFIITNTQAANNSLLIKFVDKSSKKTPAIDGYHASDACRENIRTVSRGLFNTSFTWEYF